jgi:hypothetical protein
MFSKSREWNYEREFRFVFHLPDLIPGKLANGQKGFFLDIWESTIVSVIFGCMISAENEEKLRRVLTLTRFSGVNRFRTQRHHRAFSLNIVSEP